MFYYLVYIGNVDWNMKVLISDIFCIYCVCWDKVKRMKDVTFYDFSTVSWQEYVYMNVRRTVCIHTTKLQQILFSKLLKNVTNLCMLQYWKYFVLSLQVKKNCVGPIIYYDANNKKLLQIWLFRNIWVLDLWTSI